MSQNLHSCHLLTSINLWLTQVQVQMTDICGVCGDIGATAYSMGHVGRVLSTIFENLEITIFGPLQLLWPTYFVGLNVWLQRWSNCSLAARMKSFCSYVVGEWMQQECRWNSGRANNDRTARREGAREAEGTNWHSHSHVCLGPPGVLRTLRRQDVSPTDVTPTISDVSPTHTVA